MNDKQPVTLKVIPVTGMVTIENLADFLEIAPAQLQQALSDNGVKTLALNNRFNKRLVSLADINATIGKPKNAVQG